MAAQLTPTAAPEYDAVVVGASLAGSTAAMMLGRSGARVALLDRSADPQAFKRICSHFIQSSAVPTLERLGLIGPIEEAGGVRSYMRAWTRWGWIAMSSHGLPAGVNLRREHLDPLMRRMAAETPGVDLVLGARVDRLLFTDGRTCGVEAVDRAGTRTAFRGRLIVGADGRDSQVAELARVRTRTRRHGRFAYGAYYEGPPPAGAPDATLWFMDPQWGAAFPTDGGLTFYACMLTKDRYEAFKVDRERALEDFIAGLPEPPPIRESRAVSPVLGKLEMPNVSRGPIGPGLALVGDAALATDPLWGVGCGWAFQSAEWMADTVAPALRGEEPLARALGRYRRRFRHALAGHAMMIHDYASGRRLNGAERLLWSAAPRDERLSSLMEAFGTRNMTPGSMLARALPRALVVHARESARGRRRSPEPESAAVRPVL